MLAIIFFIVTTFAIVTGYGMDKAGTQWPQDSGGAVVGLSAQYMTLWFGKLLLLLLTISAFASALGTANFTTRVAFSWGHEAHAGEFAELEARDVGKALSEARRDVALAVRTWIYYAGWPTKLTSTTNPADPGVVSYKLREPLGSEVVENIDVLAPARDGNPHLLRWMR